MERETGDGMKNVFLISEFAQLRNININSLRYYEKLGILKPAYTNPETNYRYYTSEQLRVLDIILLCVRLGVPLKELEQYIDEGETLNVQNLLLQGKALLEKQIRKAYEDISMIDHLLYNIEGVKAVGEKTSFYTRAIGERHVVTSDWVTQLPERKQIERWIAKLYAMAQKDGLQPVLPPGLLARRRGEDKTEYCFFLEIVTAKEYPNIVTLPNGEYLCTRLAMREDIKMEEAICDAFGKEAGALVVVYNMQQEKFSFANQPCELQKLERPSD